MTNYAALLGERLLAVGAELARHILTFQNVGECYLFDLLGPLLPLSLVLRILHEGTEKLVVGHGSLFRSDFTLLQHLTAVTKQLLKVRIVLMVLRFDS